MKLIKLMIMAILFLIFLPASLIFSQNIKPEEPDIFLPSVVLEVEDLSVESIVAPLPEEEMLPPDVDFPLPNAGDLEISENVINMEPTPVGNEANVSLRKGKLRTDTTLGIGTLNNFYSYISLYSFATNPEGKLTYEHETADGFSGQPSSLGYNSRSDQIYAGISYKKRKFDFEGDGSFNEIERGLQRQSSYYSKINRFINFNADITYTLNDRINLSARLKNTFDSQKLTGGVTPYNGALEYYVSPMINAEYQLNNGILGVKSSFGYRAVDGYNSLSLARFIFGGYFDYDIFDRNRVKTEIGLYLNSNNERYIPFNIGVQSNVNDFLSVSAEGGYRLVCNNLYDIFKDYPFIAIPDSLSDTTAWYLKGGAMWIANEKWALTSSLEFSRFMKEPGFNGTLTANGIFQFKNYSGDMLSYNMGARWIINDILSTRFKITVLLGNIPLYMNRFDSDITLEGISKNGHFGGDTEFKYLINKLNPDQLPELNMSAFYRVNDYFRFSLEVNDLIQTISDKKRYSFYPYLDRGFFITIKTSINF